VALERALDDSREQNVDRVICLGDIVGYGPDPLACVEMVRERCTWSLCGNHDVALFLPVAVGFNRIAREAIDWHRRLLKPNWFSFTPKVERWGWLQSLQPSRREGEVLYVHGSPRDPFLEYVEEGDVADMGFGAPRKIVEIFDKIPWLCFCGHSHRPGVVTDDYTWYKIHDLEGASYVVPRIGKTLVNVGSVGQPRDHDPRLCYVIYDDERPSVEFRRVTYDVQAAQARFRAHSQLHERSGLRLTDGN
jgi:diadenosine tetraphosphatase ApaH/serine/threonine PP2A family protein phosphatase